MTTPFATPTDRPTVHMNETAPDRSIPDHADAFASILRRAAKLIAAGENAEDIARDLLPIVRIAARYI